ncbi:MAG: Ig-like domain-containing protein [Kofleriaceae bacterium]
MSITGWRSSLWISLPALLIACTGEIGTGGPSPSDPMTSEEDPSLEEVLIDEVSEMPSEGGASEGPLVDAVALVPRRTIFLNRNGGTYAPHSSSYGVDSRINRTWMVSGTVNMPAFSKGDAAWQSLVSCVRDQFARFNVTITDVDPGTSASHIEVLVSGTPGLIGKGSGVGGTSPVTSNCSTIENSIAFAFEKQYSSITSLCATVAHEAGHSIGLDHEYLCKDPMTYLSGCGTKSWQDQNARCGENTARDCRCVNPITGTKANQNTHQFLRARLGEAPGGGGDDGVDAGVPDAPPPTDPRDPVAPSVAINSPADGAHLRANRTMTVSATAADNVGVTRVELQWLFNGKVIPCDNTVSGFRCSRSGNTYVWRFSVGTGDRTFRVSAVDAAGNRATTSDRTIHLR